MIRLHDTMARKKREFVPQDTKRITIYVCGPTVYGRAHIGNARPAVIFDLLRRVLEHAYPDAEVIYARNVTDVDDKIINSAREEGVDTSVITDRYERFYLEDMGALGVNPPTIAPHATQEIGPMVAMIERLVASGNAYEAEGHVLFSVPSDPDYGALSRRDREQMIAGARVEVAPYKRDPADFVLWKPSDPDTVGWDSPWGRGRPGWHIECSAMIREHLGETIDIHGGGLDLIFPHHENEIAQSRCAHGGKPLARYWVHNGFVDMGAEKMSKSLGNIVTPEELLKSHAGETLRLALLSAHYRQPLAWTDELVEQSKATLDRLYRAAGDAEATAIDQGVVEALYDDLNTPLALSRLLALDDAGALKASAQFLGLLTLDSGRWFRGAGDAGDIDARIAARTEAKARRDFAEADRIRDELKAEGVLLEDGPAGTTWRRA
ncbi:cysteine--tRNA ligase [Sphingomonas sp. RB56-2]|uniref:Cysteine--tRNA ligase n=1 Tax=Sphingomonas brevis TaxID=2908206 RepID=A0ABT0S623_9SPHN|nr:cysteine--tRNA ligase [Sphingomonas brevis]MCL6739839.1 cysteine--tRNA ligase [Sphingomonas brevis]